ncbi:hypothetical protein PILCRDRAFT_819988 [Piloderma croceum F 1598]|uniref:Uncharacterized protein n=1 Tax=Piloderma croceum (strain F 1598) TaxID=765440 RepID=A0A0C3BZ89_PILCF|nr:hypothetical protein PILCRDRAFT_819988 [Piloderma croceum F 1598]
MPSNSYNTVAKHTRQHELGRSYPGTWNVWTGSPAAISKGCNTVPDIWVQFTILQELLRAHLFWLRIPIKVKLYRMNLEPSH